MRDESIRSGDEAKERLPLPVLAVVPNMQGNKTEKRVLMPTTGVRNGVANTQPPSGFN
jgi:hypothetical protein